MVEFQPELLKNEANLIRSTPTQDRSLTAESSPHAGHCRQCEAYLADLGRPRLTSHRFPASGALKPRPTDRSAAVEQSSRFDAAVHSLTQRDPAEEPAAAAERLTQETVSLLSMIHRFRDCLATALLAILRQEPRLRKVEDRQKMDPLTKTPNRIGMELQLQEWWEHNRFRDRENCAILVDFDRFENINLQFGAAAAETRLARSLSRYKNAWAQRFDLPRAANRDLPWRRIGRGCRPLADSTNGLRRDLLRPSHLKSLEPSSRSWPRTGPATFSPAWRKNSARPSESPRDASICQTKPKRPPRCSPRERLPRDRTGASPRLRSPLPFRSQRMSFAAG